MKKLGGFLIYLKTLLKCEDGFKKWWLEGSRTRLEFVGWVARRRGARGRGGGVAWALDF